MTVVKGAFDSSKDHPRGVTVVAGYVANVAAWEAVERQWDNQLALAGLNRFRLSEVKHRFRDWLSVVEPFAEIAGKGLRSITASLKDTDWATLNHDSEYRKLCPHREHACLDMLFGVLAEDVALEFNGAPTCIVFDNDWGNRDAIVRIHDTWASRTRYPRFDVFLKGDTGWDAVPLQCADLIAGLMRLSPDWRAQLDRGPGSLEAINLWKDPIAKIASSAAGNGRGTMWSAAIAAEVEKVLRRKEDGGEGG
jgi:hypothetical protein